MKTYKKITSILGLVFFIALVVQCPMPVPPTIAPPAAPGAPILTPGNTQIGVSWTAVNDATSYNVFYNTSNNSGTATQFGGDITGTSTTITGRTNGILYYVWLKAKNAGGSSSFSPVSSATPVPSVPGAPAAPTLTPGNTQIGVGWTIVSGATSYNVFYNTTDNSGTATQFGGDITGTSTTITSLANGTLYYVWLKAKNAGGTSTFSPVSSATPVPTVPGTPGAPTLTPGTAQIGVSWSTVSGATAYNVYYNTTNNSGTSTQFGGDYTGTSTTITSLLNGTLYFVWIKAKNAGGSSPFSPVSSATTAPGAPGAPTLTPGTAQIGVSWSTVTGATYYNVYYNTTNNSGTATQFGGDYTGTSTTITGLSNGILYFVWMRSKNAAGTSPFSTVSSATTAPAAPGAPTLTPGVSQIGVSWSTVTGATSYNVYYNTSNNSGTATQFGGDYTGTSTTITGLSNGILYYVWMRAKNAAGTSPFSTVSSCTLPPNAPGAPALISRDSALSVSWTTVSGATSYNVFYYTSNNSVSAWQFGGDYTGTSTTITGLSNGTLYYVWLKAKNAGGTSPFSSYSRQRPGLCYQALGGGSVDVSRFDGKYIYTMITAQPAAKPEGSGTPGTTYAYSMTTATGTPSMIAPLEGQELKDGGPSSEIQVYSIKQTNFDLFARNSENQLLASRQPQVSKAPPGIDAAAPYPISVGTTWTGVNIVLNDPVTVINTTCRYISSHAYFFIDNRDITAMQPYLAAYGTSFDAIYDINHSHFGTENDVDGNGKVIIIFSQELTGGVLGYFWAGDKYSKTYIPDSNEGDIFYIASSYGADAGLVNGALAHEFQHMIYFDEHYDRSVTSSYAWLNEALSQAAEFYNNYLDNHENWMFSYLYSGWPNLSLTYWTSSNYGYGAIFIRYLIDRFGDTAIKNMCATNLIGIAAVESATGTNFNTIFNDFSRALAMSGTGDSTDPKYNFTTLNLLTLQPYGRGGLRYTTSYAAGNTISGSAYPYRVIFYNWTGSFGTMNMTGTDIIGTAFGLSR